MAKTYLLTFSGRDNPGITEELTGMLANYPILLLDLAQTVVYQHLHLSFLIEIKGLEPSLLLSKAQTIAATLDLKFAFQPMSIRARGIEIQEPSLRRYAVTLISRQVTAKALHHVSSLLARRDCNIDVIKRLSEDSLSCVEMLVSSADEIDGSDLRKEILALTQDENVDIAFQPDDFYRRAKRLVVLDMDSTLIQSEVIDELARENGVFSEVSRLTHLAMQGKLEFDESLRRRCALLKGLSSKRLEKVYERIRLTPGASELIFVLRKLGYRTAVISGGFTFVSDRLKEKLSIDFAYANVLEIEKGKLTGRVIPPIVNAQRKADLLEVIAQKEQIELGQVIAIGDGANDLLMLEKAGLGIAFNAKPVVQEKADLAFSQKNMQSILYLLGLSEREISGVLSSSF